MKTEKNRLHSVMVVGATPAGVAAANKLGELGIPVILVDRDADLNRKLGAEAYRLHTGVPLSYALRPGLIRILRNPAIQCIMPATVLSARHHQQGFSVKIAREQTFVDPSRCTLCGRCVEICPVTADSGEKPVRINSRFSLPGRAAIDKRRQPLCQAACPLGVNVQGYTALAKAGRYAEALALIREDNVLPAICGRVCTHPCEAACRRAEKDEPVAIRDIKRFCADSGRPDGPSARHTGQPLGSHRIAVIGSGPAGLAAATDLARRGYRVTVLEKEADAGGLLRYGIGPHRLPREILDRELQTIRAEGVGIVTSHPVALPDGLSDLKKEFSAVILATGSWADRPLGVAGEDLAGVEGCLWFLRRVNRGEVFAFHGKTAVIGDGNAAFDLARVLCRLGAEVTVLSWFSLNEIPADEKEVAAAVDEGVVIADRRQVVSFAGENGRLRALRIKPTRPGRPDAQGIAWPEIIQEAESSEMAFDHAFIAIGQTGAHTALSATGEIPVTQRGFIHADDSGRTGIAGVYAAGDAVTGASSVVHAMARGRMTAATVHRDLCRDRAVPEIPSPVRPEGRDFTPMGPHMPAVPRVPMPEIPLDARRGNFNEVARGFDAVQIQAEAGRCLQCGGCSQCLECVKACGANRAVDHGEPWREQTENAGVIIVADPEMMPGLKGEDVIRAYGGPGAKSDVYAMLLRGFAAAAKAMTLIRKTDNRMKGHGISFVPPDPGLSPIIRMGVFACRCNDSFGWLPAMDAYLESLRSRAHIVCSETLESACIPEGISRIVAAVREKGLTRVVLASCVCCPLNFICSACTDQRSRIKNGLFTGTGISRSMVQTCNLRGEVLRLTQKDPQAACDRFAGLMERSMKRAASLLPFPAPPRTYNFTTAVIGQTEAAEASAMILAETGQDVLMFGTHKHPVHQGPCHPNIHVFQGSRVTGVTGTLGDFTVAVQDDAQDRVFSVGAVILGEKSRNIELYRRPYDISGHPVQSAMQKSGVPGIPFMYPGTTSISGLFLADPPGVQVSKQTKGAAAAVLAAAVMPRGARQNRGFSVVIHESLCRGCGRCLKVCPYHAVSLQPREPDRFAAVVDEALCKGCGNCISVCPSNAADSPYRDQVCLEQTLEEMLAGKEHSRQPKDYGNKTVNNWQFTICNSQFPGR